jgi:hypothetical protein
VSSSKLRIGRVLGRSVRTWLHRLPAFSFISALAHAPALYLAWGFAHRQWGGPAAAMQLVLVMLAPACSGWDRSSARRC